MANSFRDFFRAQDMTVGKPVTNLLRFSVPLLIGNIAQQLYSTVDAIVVGRVVGSEALAAIGASFPVVNLLIVFFVAISTGAGVMVSQYFGAKEKETLSDTVGMAVFMIVAVSLVMTVIGVLASPWLLRLTNTPADVFDMANDYLRIIFIGIIGGGFYNIISGLLRGLGDSTMPLLFLLAATLLNTVLDILFVWGFKMGVAGAAWATIIAQGISGALCMIRICSMRQIVTVDLRRIRPHPRLARQMLRLGLPGGLTQMIFSLSSVMVQNLTNSLGVLVMATSVAVMRVDGFAMMPNFTFGMATSTFVGQNVGAQRLDRVKEGSKEAVKMMLLVSVVLTISLLLFGQYLLRMFTDESLVIELGVRMIRILAVGYIAVGISQVFSGIMRGAGDTMPSMWISIITSVALRIPIAYLWAYLTRTEQWPNGNPDALYFSLVITWVIGALLSYLWYRTGRWKKKALIRQTNPVGAGAEAPIE